MQILSLLTGLLGLVCFALTVPLKLGMLGIVGIALSLLAIGTGVLRRQQKMGLVGLVLGGIGLVVALIGFLYFDFNGGQGSREQPAATPAPR